MPELCLVIRDSRHTPHQREDDRMGCFATDQAYQDPRKDLRINEYGESAPNITSYSSFFAQLGLQVNHDTLG